MLLPDSRDYEPTRRSEHQRVHKPALHFTPSLCSYRGNAVHLLQQLSVLLAVVRVHIPQADAVVVAARGQHVGERQRVAADHPAPAGQVHALARAVHAVGVLHVIPTSRAYLHGVDRLLLVSRVQTERAVDVSCDEVLVAGHGAALDTLVQPAAAVHHLRVRLDLPQAQGVVRGAAQNAGVVVRGHVRALTAQRRDQGLMSISMSETPWMGLQCVHVGGVDDVPEFDGVVLAARVQLHRTAMTDIRCYLAAATDW